MGALKGAVTRRQFLNDVATSPPGVLAQYLANTEVGLTAATDPMLALYAWLLLATKGQLPPESTSTLADVLTLTAKNTPITTTTNSPAPTSVPTAGSRKIQAHDTDAKNRNGSEWYGADVNQAAVYTMLRQGVPLLQTSEGSEMPRVYTLVTYIPPGREDGSVRRAVSCGDKYGWL